MFKPTFVVFSIFAVINPAFALWPRPQNAELGSSALRLSPHFEIITEIHGVPQDLSEAIERTKSYLYSDKLGRLVVGRGSSDASEIKSAKTLSKLTLSLEKGTSVKSITEEVQKSLESRDESYALTVPSNGGEATITANTTLGLFRGLTTFGQLWYTYDGTIYSTQTPVKVADTPAYVCHCRLDVDIFSELRSSPALSWIAFGHFSKLVRLSCRYIVWKYMNAFHSFPVDDIKRTLDAMSWVKVSDWRLRIIILSIANLTVSYS